MYKYSAVLWFSLTEEDFIIETYFINSCVFILLLSLLLIIIIINYYYYYYYYYYYHYYYELLLSFDFGCIQSSCRG